MGSLTSVTLKDEDSEKSMDIVIKISPFCPPLDHILQDFFEHEICFYSTLMPLLKEEDLLLDFIPNCLYTDLYNRVLAMEDMRSKGFKRSGTGFYLDEARITLTLEAIAKFHALTFILNKKQLPHPETLRPFSSEYPTFYTKTQRFIWRKYAILFEGMKCENILNHLYQEIVYSSDFINLHATQARSLVYGHGDLWKENILFKYSDVDPNIPVQVCLVDFQLTRLLPPAADVLSFIMNSAESSVRRKHFDTFISIYHNALQETLKANGLSKSLYSEEDLTHDLKLVVPSCLSLIFLSLTLWLQLETPQSVVEEDMKFLDKKEIIGRYKDMVEDLILHFKDLGLIIDPKEKRMT